MAACAAMPTYRVTVLLFLLANWIGVGITSEISDLRRCADKACRVTISTAHAIGRHSASSPLFLSFNRGDIIAVKSKSAGSRPDLWGGEVNGKRGYFPKSYVKELKVLETNLIFEVPTEESEFTKKAPSLNPPQVPEPPKTKQESSSQTEKDETEIDETDLTDLEDAADAPSAQSGTLKAYSAASSTSTETTEEERDETELEDGNPVFNDFLASKFAAESSQFASAVEKEITKLAEEEQKKIADGEPAGGLHVDDETELETEDDDFLFPSDVDQGLGNTVKENDVGQTLEEEKKQREDVEKQVKEEENSEEEAHFKKTQEEEKEENPYVSGVRVFQMDDDEEEEEGEPVIEETKDEVRGQVEQGSEDKPEADNRQEDVDSAKEAARERGDETVEDETELHADSAQEDIKDHADLPTESGKTVGEQFTMDEKQGEGKTAPGQDQTQGKKEPGDQPKMVSPDVPQAGTPAASGEDSAHDEDKPGTEAMVPKLGGERSATKSLEMFEYEKNKELHFRSEVPADDQEDVESENVVYNVGQDITKEETADTEKMKVQRDGDTPDADESVDDKDQQAKEKDTLDASVDEDKDVKIEPEKTVTQPPQSSDKKAYQPVDIDFIQPSHAQVQVSTVTLESSQTEPQQQWQAQTPVLQGTPSLEHPGQHSVSEQGIPPKMETIETEKPTDEDETPTSVVDGTTFYVIDGELADIVPESVSEGKRSAAATPEPVMSPPPAQATLADNIQPTAVPPVPEMSTQQHNKELLEKPFSFATDRKEQGAKNITQGMSAGSAGDGAEIPKPEEILQRDLHNEHYQTNADFVSRKVLSVGQPASQIPTPPSPAAEPAIPAKQKVHDLPRTTNIPQAQFQESSLATDTLINSASTASDIQPSASADAGGASVTVEGEEDREDNQTPGGGSDEEEVSPPLAFDVPPAEDMVSVRDGDTDKPLEQTVDTATQPPEAQIWDGIPQPPAHDDVTPPSKEWVPIPNEQTNDEPTREADPYQTDDYYSRKITDDDLAKAEEEVAAYGSGLPTVMGSLEARTKTFIDKLPPSLQSLLEQEPLGLSPAMTILVTTTTLAMFLTITCFSCLCSGSKKSGKKDPLVVVRELEERLLMAVKEKENLEDLLQERQSEANRLKEELAGVRNSSSNVQTDLQTVTLHNEALKVQVESLQTEIVQLQDQLSRKADDVKVKDKKTKDIEKETKKLNEAKSKLETELQKKKSENRMLEDENENLKSAIQSLTDQVQLLDTSKQQLLAEAEDWKEKVDELKERLDQQELECKQAQETISFKDNELEVMKDCYLNLKAFEKDGGQGDDEEFDTGNNQAVQAKIQAMMDVSKVNATLRAVQEEKDSLDNKLKIENDARKELEEQLECVRREMESSMADKMKAERQCQEAQTKLAVLSTYFKEKELQLQRELGEQEALKKQNLSKLDCADETTRTLAKELELNKQQAESLKRELAASERDFRSQIAANEKKAHENWLNARAAERELKEARHEAAVLRQKLTDVERRQMGPGGLIRPLPTRGVPPPGMLNGPPPPPGMERSPSRGSLPPGPIPPGPPPPPFRDEDGFLISLRDRQRLPPSHPALHMPPPDARSPPPRMPPDSRVSPPRLPPPDARSPPPRVPPPYDRRGPPHLMDSHSPPMRLPPPDMVPPLRGPFPPHMGPHPPMGSPGLRDSAREGYPPRDVRPGQSPREPYGRQPPPGGETRRHQSQV